MKRALCASGIVLAAFAILITLFSVAEHPDGIPIPVFRMDVDLDSAEGFEEVVPKATQMASPSSPFAKAAPAPYR